MKYKSTRGQELYSCSEAIIKGLADDGGLFIPESIGKIGFNDSWLSLSYQEIAEEVLGYFFTDFEEDEIELVIRKAYNEKNFKDGMVGFKHLENRSYLELYHGPTLAFKDMALTILPHLIELACKKINYQKKITILTATSGDTGGAALSGFSQSENINIVVIYPNSGVSKFQEKQMLSFTNSKAKAFAYNGNFDDCQTMVKNVFLEAREKDTDVVLSSANSINIARLVPQVIYYFYAYLELVKANRIQFGDKIDVDVPTGNFGNILAAYYAKQLGLPIDRFICASNQNNILTDFFNSGVYDCNRVFYKTSSPSMDILVSSNLERLIAQLSQNTSFVNSCMNDLKDKKQYALSEEVKSLFYEFDGYYATEEETSKCIKEVYDKENYLIDPHTAVATVAYEKSKKERYTLIVSTASPVKFADSINDALGFDGFDAVDTLIKNTNFVLPVAAKKVLESKKERIVFTKEEIIEYIFSNKKTVKASGSSANFAVGFDIVGLAVDVFNKFTFYPSKHLKMLGFEPQFSNPKNNLVYHSFEYVFKKLNKEIPNVTIILSEENIPISRGLGSSSSCIIAGVLIAEYFARTNDKDFLLKCMVEIEGHPDNVAPAYLGGFVASYKTEHGYRTIQYPVSNELTMIICYPDFELSTELSRSVLPKEISVSDFVYDASRIIHLPKALMDGDIIMLQELLEDKIHQPYRYPLIQDSDLFVQFAKDNNSACCISGAGPSLLFITINPKLLNNLKKIKTKAHWSFIECRINEAGSFMEE